jgi:signal transduction histidine kinase/CheY-like chemotaxis protein
MLEQPNPRIQALSLLFVTDAAEKLVTIAEQLMASTLPFTYDVATNEAAYQTLIATKSYDAIAIDSQFNRFSAVQAARHLQRSGQTIPLIAIALTAPQTPLSLNCDTAMNGHILSPKTDENLADWLAALACERETVPTPGCTAALPQRDREVSLSANETISAMWQPMALNERLQIAARDLCRVLETSHCLVFSHETEARCLAAATAQGPSRAFPTQSQDWQSDRFFPPGLAGNLNGPTVRQRVTESGCTETILTVPLCYQNIRLGTLCLYSRETSRQHHGWTPHQIRLVEMVALQCAIAIHQDQLDCQLAAAQNHRQLIAHLHEQLNTDLGFPAILQDMMKLVGQHFAVERVVLLNFSEEAVTIEQEWRSHDRIPSLLKECLPSSEWQELFSDRSDYQVQRYLQIENYPQYCAAKTQTAQIQKHSQTISLLSVPLFKRDRLVGSLTLETVTRSRRFNAAEIQLSIDIANQIAIAFTSAKHLEALEIEVQARSRDLEAANQAKSELLSTMSHELRTPLTSIIGFSRMLLEQIYGELNSKQNQYVNAIFTAGEHLLSLINDLLDISKIEANKEELFIEPLAVEEVCLAATSLLQEQANQAGLDLNLAIDPRVTLCYADRRRIKQILVNLLSNAIKFTETGSITLQVTLNDHRLDFAVIDTGIGMNAEDVANLFQPFYQGKTHRHNIHKGTGLGLALSRKLARLHNGDLTVTSELNRGSCFTLHLPQQHI